MIARYALVLFFTTSLFPTTARALDTAECAEMARGCLTRSKSAKDECFRTLSSSPLCVGSEIGELITKRARVSSAYPDSEDAGPGFLGPQILDRPCVDAFDARLRMSMMTGAPASSEMTSLSRFLERCVQPPSPNLYRP